MLQSQLAEFLQWRGLILWAKEESILGSSSGLLSSFSLEEGACPEGSRFG